MNETAPKLTKQMLEMISQPKVSFSGNAITNMYLIVSIAEFIPS